MFSGSLFALVRWHDFGQDYGKLGALCFLQLKLLQ